MTTLREVEVLIPHPLWKDELGVGTQKCMFCLEDVTDSVVCMMDCPCTSVMHVPCGNRFFWKGKPFPDSCPVCKSKAVVLQVLRKTQDGDPISHVKDFIVELEFTAGAPNLVDSSDEEEPDPLSRQAIQEHRSNPPVQGGAAAARRRYVDMEAEVASAGDAPSDDDEDDESFIESEESSHSSISESDEEGSSGSESEAKSTEDEEEEEQASIFQSSSSDTESEASEVIVPSRKRKRT